MPENKRRGLFERIFTRRTKETKPLIEVSNTKVATLDEMRQQAIKKLDDKKIDEAIDLIKNFRVSDASIAFQSELPNTLSEDKLFNIYRQMDNDSIISAALDLFADNATQVNTKTGHVASIESADKNFQDEINSFLWDIANVDTELWNVARSIALYGKVILDTKASMDGLEWGFLEVERPEYVLPLTYGQDKIAWFAVTNDPNNFTKVKQRTDFAQYQIERTESEFSPKVEPGDRYIAGFNARKHIGKITVKETDALTGKEVFKDYNIRAGKSYLEGVIETWRMLSTLEDSMFISRLVKSKAFNLVTIDVSDSDNKQIKDMVDSVKNSLRSAETIDLMSNRYQDRTSPIPANDFVYVPKKGEKGVVTIEQVGGEVGAQDLADIEYLRNKLFAGLGVLKAYLGFEETTPGGLGETTLTMLDERFTRKVKRLRSSLQSVVKQMIEYYWTNSTTDRTLEIMPEYNIIMGKLSTQEEAANKAELATNIGLANDILGLANAFPDLIDQEKMFNYLFNEVIGIDPAKFDNNPEATEIEVTAHNLDEQQVKKLITEALNQRTRLKEKAKPIKKKASGDINTKLSNMLEGTIKTLLAEAPIEDLLKEYTLFVETDKGKRIPLYEALDQRDLRHSLTEATYKDLKNKTKIEDPVRLAKSKKIIGKYTGLDENNFITFRMTAEDPNKNRSEGRPTSYETKVHLKALINIIESRRAGETDLNIVRNAVADDIAVSCTCPAAKYWGMQWRGTQEGYSIDINNIAPTVLEPKQPICKHVHSMLTLLPFWTNTIVRDLRARGLLTATSQAKISKAKEEPVEPEVIDAVEQEVENEIKQTKEERLAAKAPQTISKSKAKKVELEVEVEDDTEETEVEEE